MSRPKCEICEAELDERGKCAECYGVTPRQIAVLRQQVATIVVCPEHGAYEPIGRPVKIGSRVVREGRQRFITGGRWVWPCPICGIHLTEIIKITCLRREEDFLEDVAELRKRWGKDIETPCL